MAKKPAKTVESAKPPVVVVAQVVPPARDPRRFIYVAIDVIFTIAYIVVLNDLLHNRHPWARAVMYVLPLATATMALGTFLGRKLGWYLTIAAGAAMLLWTVGFLILLLTTASYLSGVYGSFGKAAASGMMLAVALVVELVAFLPALQLKWSLTRAGRRAFGLPLQAAA